MSSETSHGLALVATAAVVCSCGGNVAPQAAPMSEAPPSPDAANEAGAEPDAASEAAPVAEADAATLYCGPAASAMTDATAEGGTLVVPLNCGPGGPRFHLTLPCQVGMGIHVVECSVHSDAMEGGPVACDSTGATWAFIFAYPVALSNLGQPIDFSTLAPIPVACGDVAAQDGQVVVCEADLNVRTFSGRILHLDLLVGQTACSLDDVPFWAIPGNFI